VSISVPQPFLDIRVTPLRREPRRRWTIPEIARAPQSRRRRCGRRASRLPLWLSRSHPFWPSLRQSCSPKFDAPSTRAAGATPTVRKPQTRPRPNSSSPRLCRSCCRCASGDRWHLCATEDPRHRSDASSPLQRPLPRRGAAKTDQQPGDRGNPAPFRAVRNIATRDSLKTAEKKRMQSRWFGGGSANSCFCAHGTFPIRKRAEPPPRPLPNAVSPRRDLPRSPRRPAPAFKASCASASAFTSDPTGNVSEASLDSAGPSSIFADLALKTARRWQFSSPDMGGHSVPSEWLIRFQFSRTGPKPFQNK